MLLNVDFPAPLGDAKPTLFPYEGRVLGDEETEEDVRETDFGR